MLLSKLPARFWDPNYYRTYSEAEGQPAGYMSVQAEVTRALEKAEDFVDVPRDAAHQFAKTSGVVRDSATNSKPAWVVRDGNYVSARWPGDVYTFSRELDAVLVLNADAKMLDRFGATYEGPLERDKCNDRKTF